MNENAEMIEERWKKYPTSSCDNWSFASLGDDEYEAARRASHCLRSPNERRTVEFVNSPNTGSAASSISLSFCSKQSPECLLCN